MIRKAASVVLFAFAAPSFGAPVDIACFWDEPLRYQAGPATVLETLYGKASEPAYFSIDVDAGSAAHSDPSKEQAVLLPKLSLFPTRETVKVIAVSPNIQALQNTRSTLEITINRYTLKSIMTLAMPSSTSDVMAAQWSRAGQCYERKL